MTPRSKAPFRIKINWKDGLIKLLIGFVLVVDLVLIAFIVRRCSKPSPKTEVFDQGKARTLQIEVLNGCGVPGIAGQFTEYLRAKGFDVVKMENYESFNVTKTIVIDRQGNLQGAIQVAEALGLGKERAVQEVNDTYLLDISVVLGKDFRDLKIWKEMEK
jgi:hypothetical protein